MDSTTHSQSKDNPLRILAMSDMHGEFPRVSALPDAQFVLIAGDFTNHGDMTEKSREEVEAAKAWMWQLAERYGCVYFVCGNHDFNLGNTTLGAGVDIDGKQRIHGIERVLVVQSRFNLYGASMSPAFNAPRVAAAWCRMTADRVFDQAEWDGVPYADIILSHCPPEGFLDRSGHVLDLKAGRWNTEPLGSPGLLRYLIKNRPKLVVCGHVHEARGTTHIVYLSDDMCGNGEVVAVSGADFMNMGHEYKHMLGQTYVVNCARKPELITIDGHSITSETVELSQIK